MSIYLQIALFIASVLTFVFVVYCSKKHKMNIKYSIVWIIWSIGIIIISLFPKIVYFISNLLNITVAVNTLYLIMIFLLYLLSFYLFLKISIMNDRLKDISYQIAMLKKEIQDMRQIKKV